MLPVIGLSATIRLHAVKQSCVRACFRSDMFMHYCLHARCVHAICQTQAIRCNSRRGGWMGLTAF